MQVCLSLERTLLEETNEALAGYQGQLRNWISKVTLYVRHQLIYIDIECLAKLIELTPWLYLSNPLTC